MFYKENERSTGCTRNERRRCFLWFCLFKSEREKSKSFFIVFYSSPNPVFGVVAWWRPGGPGGGGGGMNAAG